MDDPFDRLARDAISARAYVERERGAWVVYLEVLFLNEVLTRKIGSYSTQHLAWISTRRNSPNTARN
jgi:hypothetical protein